MLIATIAILFDFLSKRDKGDKEDKAEVESISFRIAIAMKLLAISCV
jgi:hypothetical protein